MEPFIGEIRMMGFNYAPQGWAFCNGQYMEIAQNDALFSLLSTIYGGDGVRTFQLPDLQGRIPIHRGAGPGLIPRFMGQKGGAETATLTEAHLPSHRHVLAASGDGAGTADPTGAIPAVAGVNVYGPAQNLVPMADSALGATGSGAAHENLPPFTVINFCIALWGVYPPRN